MGTIVDNILYHVRAAPPSNSRTLRFRNKFQHKSCLFATANEGESVRDWFSRHITATYPFVESLEWSADVLCITFSNDMPPDTDWMSVLGNIKTYVYRYNLDIHWNKHPTKNCYMTRSNVKYRANPKAITFLDAIQNRRIDIKFGATHAKA